MFEKRIFPTLIIIVNFPTYTVYINKVCIYVTAIFRFFFLAFISILIRIILPAACFFGIRRHSCRRDWIFDSCGSNIHIWNFLFRRVHVV